MIQEKQIRSQKAETAHDSQHRHETTLSHPGLKAITEVVRKVEANKIPDGRDPLVRLSVDGSNGPQDVFVVFEKDGRTEHNHYLLRTNTTETTIGQIEDDRLTIRSLGILKATNADFLHVCPAMSSAEEQLIVSGVSLLTEKDIWNPGKMRPLIGLPLTFARADRNPKIPFLEERTGRFWGVVYEERNAGRPTILLGDGRLVQDPERPIEYVAPVIVADRCEWNSTETSLARSTGGVRTFLQELATQGATVSVETLERTAVGVFRNLDGNNAIIQTETGFERFQCANAGTTSQIRSVSILSPSGETLPYGSTYRLQPIFNPPGARQPIRRIVNNEWRTEFDKSPSLLRLLND